MNEWSAKWGGKKEELSRERKIEKQARCECTREDSSCTSSTYAREFNGVFWKFGVSPLQTTDNFTQHTDNFTARAPRITRRERGQRRNPQIEETIRKK